jgi:hypothetical protein
MQYLYHVLSLRDPVFIRPAELGGIQQVFFIKWANRLIFASIFDALLPLLLSVFTFYFSSST